MADANDGKIRVDADGVTRISGVPGDPQTAGFPDLPKLPEGKAWYSPRRGEYEAIDAPPEMSRAERRLLGLAGKPEAELDRAGKELVQAGKPDAELDRAGKKLGQAGKELDRAGKKLDQAGKPDAELDRAGKKLDQDAKAFEKDPEKYIKDKFGPKLGEVLDQATLDQAKQAAKPLQVDQTLAGASGLKPTEVQQDLAGPTLSSGRN